MWAIRVVWCRRCSKKCRKPGPLDVVHACVHIPGWLFGVADPRPWISHGLGRDRIADRERDVWSSIGLRDHLHGLEPKESRGSH